MISPDESDMITNAVDPLILEIYLYTNNYKDRLLISELKSKAQTIKIPGIDDTSFFVKVDDMYDILHDKFRKDLRDFDSTPYDTLNGSVTSIYFIESIMRAFHKMKYFRINVSDSQIYTRKVNDKISFDYRVIHSRVDLPIICTPEYLAHCKRIFKNIGVYGNDPFDKTPYFEIAVADLFNKLRSYSMNFTEEDDELNYILNLQMMFGPKLERDNCTVLVVVEK